MTQRTRFGVDEVIDERFALTEPQKDLLARRLHTAAHTVLIADFGIPDEMIHTNTEPNYTHHPHDGAGDYCYYCDEASRDGMD